MIIDNNNIYIAGFGGKINNTDCYISSISPHESQTDSLFNLSIDLGCFIEGDNSSFIDLLLIDHSDNIIQSFKEILVFETTGSQNIVLEGLYKKDFSVFNKVNLKTNQNELSYYNNDKYFVLEEDVESRKVLFLSGGISTNTKFIKQVINDKFPYLEIDHYFSDKKIDYDLIDTYSLIILDNFPFSNVHLNDYNYIINNFQDKPILYFEGPGLPFSIAEKISRTLDLNVISAESKNLNLGATNNSVLFDEIDFNKIPPINKNISWILQDDFSEPIAYFTNKSVATIKKDKITAVFLPSLANSNLFEYNLFNTDNMRSKFSTLIFI